MNERHESADAHDRLTSDAFELPELPIPRPGERSLRAPSPAEIAQQYTPPSHPPIGGASLTSVDPNAPAVPAQQTDDMAWEVASRITSGMLSNPSRSHCSVKDAMALFESVLHEVRVYARLLAEHEADPAGDERRRQEHRAWFEPEQPPRDPSKPRPAPDSVQAPFKAPPGASPYPPPGAERPAA